jgi:hypothetical protein
LRKSFVPQADLRGKQAWESSETAFQEDLP